jgi:predicted membrane-bound spermidine synthase
MKGVNLKYLIKYIFCFVTGFAILSIEMTLLKLIVPYSGGDIFSVSIIINSVLLALAIGYWLGGKFSKWHPGILSILAATYFALSSASYNSFGKSVINFGSPYLTTISIMFALFFIPLVIMGTITPILAEQFKKIGTGKAAGFVYAIGTMGSIIGGLLTSFILIPNLGIQKTILFSTIILMLAGIFIDFSYIKRKIIILFLIIFTLICLIISVASATGCKYENYGSCLYETETPYGSYVVIQKGDSTRIMQNRQLHSIGINRLTNKTNNYYDEFIRFNFEPDDNVLILGNSVGTMMSLINQKNSETKITGVEIDPAVTEIGQDWFNLELNEQKQVIHSDARIFLYKNKEKYSYIFIDLYQGIEVPSHTLTVEFFEEVKKDLQENGTLAINIPAYVNYNSTESATFKNLYFNTVTSVFDFCTYELKGHILICTSNINQNNEEINLLKYSGGNVFSDEFPVNEALPIKAYYSFINR